MIHVKEHKNHIEDGNKMLIKSFQTLLAQHLEVLHKIIVWSVTHQELLLHAMEEHLKSSVYEQDRVNDIKYSSNLCTIRTNFIFYSINVLNMIANNVSLLANLFI